MQTVHWRFIKRGRQRWWRWWKWRSAHKAYFNQKSTLVNLFLRVYHCHRLGLGLLYNRWVLREGGSTRKAETRAKSSLQQAFCRYRQVSDDDFRLCRDWASAAMTSCDLETGWRMTSNEVTQWCAQPCLHFPIPIFRPASVDGRRERLAFVSLCNWTILSTSLGHQVQVIKPGL